MTKETKFPLSKRLNLDAVLASRIADYRFRERISSENEAIRRLLAAGLDNAHGFFGKSPRWLIDAAKQRLFAAPLQSIRADAEPLSVAKRINLDEAMFADITEYARLLDITSENEAFRRLILVGLDIVEGVYKDGEARAFLKAALHMQLAAIMVRADAMLHSDDPEEVWRSAQEVFNEDGTLRAVDGAKDGMKINEAEFSQRKQWLAT